MCACVLVWVCVCVCVCECGENEEGVTRARVCACAFACARFLSQACANNESNYTVCGFANYANPSVQKGKPKSILTQKSVGVNIITPKITDAATATAFTDKAVAVARTLCRSRRLSFLPSPDAHAWQHGSIQRRAKRRSHVHGLATRRILVEQAVVVDHHTPLPMLSESATRTTRAILRNLG